MDPKEYGVIRTTEVTDNRTRYIVATDTKIYEIDVIGNTNKVRILGAADLTWTDTKLTEDLFKREFGKNVIFFKNGEAVVKSKQLPAKPMQKVKSDSKLANTSCFMTIDIETTQLVVEGQGKMMVPYLICGYNQDNFIYSYAKELKPSAVSSMFYDFIKQLIEIKGLKYVYAHNFAGFDGIYLLKYLISYQGNKAEPLIHNGKLIAVKYKIKIKNKVKTIIFKDSYLLLPVALRNLCAAFDVSSIKGYFPFLFNVDIHYEGAFPPFEYWKKSNISIQEHFELASSYANKNWSFKEEAIKYCKLDCKALFEVIVKFNELIFKTFNVNVHKSLTLPSLAMKIFKSKFMPEDTIYQLGGQVEADIRQAYTGGAVDLYIPTNIPEVMTMLHEGVHPAHPLYFYDVTSLYASIMALVSLPVGKPVAFEGDITSVDPDHFGFYYCKITSPNKIIHPILQKKVKTRDGLRTVAGIGSWEGWIFSLEMRCAIRHGYKFEVIRGYTFDYKIIFKDYIETMFNLRKQFPKSHPLNLIAKLLMNALYGRFGMKSLYTKLELFNFEDEKERLLYDDCLETYGELIVDHIEFDNFKLLIRRNTSNFRHEEDFDPYHGHDVNIAIAAAITAGG